MCLLGLFFIYLFACFQREEKGMFRLVGMEMGRTGDKHDQICCMKKILNDKRIMEMIKRKKKKKLLANEHQRAL